MVATLDNIPPEAEFAISFGPEANCTLEICPVEWSVYQYLPILGVQIMFIVMYGLAMLIHIFLGIKWRQIWFMVFMIFGCLCEIIGYVGRIILNGNPFSFGGFMTQIVFITTGPVFYTASIYITISKAIEFLGPDISRIRPKLFYWIFIPADFICLTLQAAGGALSTTSSGSSQVGVDLALAGLGLQVGVIVIFCGFFADYMARYFRAGRHAVLATGTARKVKIFFAGLSTATLLILGRCSYRCYELNDGYQGDLIADENLFIALEGVLILVAVYCLCFGHPGLVFRRGKGDVDAAAASSSMSEAEKGRTDARHEA